MYPISCLSVHLLSLKQLMTNVTTLKKIIYKLLTNDVV